MYHFSFPLCKPGNIVFFCHHRHLLFIFSLTFCFSQFVLKWHINIGKVAILLSACQPIQGFYGIAKNTIRIAVSMLRYIFFSIYCFVQIQNYIFTNLPYVFSGLIIRPSLIVCYLSPSSRYMTTFIPGVNKINCYIILSYFKL